jgi:hypothetical protein
MYMSCGKHEVLTKISRGNLYEINPLENIDG